MLLDTLTPFCSSQPKSLITQSCDVVTTFGGVYKPNKYYRLMKDVLTVRRAEGPISLKFSCGGGVMVKVIVKDDESGDVLWEGTGKSSVFAISISMPEGIVVEAKQEEGGGTGEEGEKKDLAKLCVEAVIDRTAMDASEYESIKPYYFTPAVVEVEGEGEAEGKNVEGEEAKVVIMAPLVPNPDGGLEWTVLYTSSRDIVSSNHMATLDFEEGVRKVWEGEVVEGEVARSDRANVLWSQLEIGGDLAKPELDEEGGVVLPGAEAGGKGKKGKKGKGGDEGGCEKPKMPMPEKGEDGAWVEEQLLTLIARSASTLVDIKLEDTRCDVRKTLDTKGDVEAPGGEVSFALLSEQDLEDIAKSDSDAYAKGVAAVQETKGRLEEEKDRCTSDVDSQMKDMADLKVKSDELFEVNYNAREEYRKLKIAEKLDAEDRAEKVRLRLEEEARLADEARIQAEKEAKKKKK